MLDFFAPRYVKEAKAIWKNAHKMLCYKRDLLSAGETAEIQEQLRRLHRAANDRDKPAAETAAQKLETLFSKHFPQRPDAGWRENTEVFLVAIVIAIGVRTYFLQPFTIPTGSMQPTLNGIIAHVTNEPAPNFLVRIAHFLVLGRSYTDAVAKSDDQIVEVTERKPLYFFTLSTVRCVNQTYRIWAPADALGRSFNVVPGRQLRAGETIARGYVSAGDHVFVDKVSFNFVEPKRGKVFVFKTTGIDEIEKRLDPAMGSQFYIKRLAGLPGDQLRIDPPSLFLNGERAHEPEFQRVMAAQDGYRGYSQGPPFGWLNAPDRPFHVPSHSYFALGDNSYNSSDSRYWGIVPEKNLMGTGMFVYWPFGSHWGFIK